MSFGQALFFGAAGYGVALMARDLNVTSILLILPAGALIGLTASLPKTASERLGYGEEEFSPWDKGIML